MRGEFNLEQAMNRIAQVESHLTNVVDKTLNTLTDLVEKVKEEGASSETQKTLATAINGIVDIQRNFKNQKADLDEIKQFVIGIDNAFNEGKLAGSVENLVKMVKASQDAEYKMDIERDEQKLAKSIFVTKIVNNK